ncbi:MAG: MscS Mechanosensitive ion channel [Bacteroidota bacterium]|jgi:small-conductance mechanosensitive channel|nr:MscS Mechanosensitive ion channel [Bacteroidota bacterium]
MKEAISYQKFISNDHSLIEKAGLSVAITAGGIIISILLLYLLKKWSKRKEHYFPMLIDKYLKLPGILLFIVITLNIDLAIFHEDINERVYQILRHALQITLIIAIGILLMRVIGLINTIILKFYQKQNRKDYKFRSLKTKFQLIQRILNVIVVVGTLASVLMTFNNVKQIGSALLASAGIAGIVIGFAAQKSLGSLLAGIQIAVSQPIKIDDTVIVEHTYGVVSEITLTYVVINTWDEKKLIVPINYFLEKPFENWTRSSPEILASVKLVVDNSISISNLRSEFEKFLTQNTLYDKRNSDLLVTDASGKTMELRLTMSAKNAEDAFRLECQVREKILNYITEKLKT